MRGFVVKIGFPPPSGPPLALSPDNHGIAGSDKVLGMHTCFAFRWESLAIPYGWIKIEDVRAAVDYSSGLHKSEQVKIYLTGLVKIRGA